MIWCEISKQLQCISMILCVGIIFLKLKIMFGTRRWRRQLRNVVNEEADILKCLQLRYDGKPMFGNIRFFF